MCPFIENAEKRCAEHWTLRNVAHAYRHCADAYQACPVYQELMDELFARSVQGVRDARLAC